MLPAFLTPPPEYWFQTHPHLSRLAAFWLWYGLTSSTHKTYSTGQCSFFEFIQSCPHLRNPDGSFLPASELAILEWAATLGSRQLQPKTIRSYIGHLKSAHVDCGLSFEGCESPLLQCMVRGIKRYMGERDRKPKMPITLDILQRLISLSDPLSGCGELNYSAAIKLAFSAFLRCGEFTVHSAREFNPSLFLTRSAFCFEPGFTTATFIVLTIPASKTDPFRKGISLFISAAPGSSTCPVTALKLLYLRNPHPPESPLFVEEDGTPLLRASLLSRLRAGLSTLGLDTSKFAGHSFHRGAASSAAASSFTDYEIQQLGCWHSDAYKLYIEPNKLRILSLSSRLHWAASLTQPFKPPSLRFAPPLA